MGYFKRPIRRSASRLARRAFLEPAREIPGAAWQRCDFSIAPAPQSFLRFVVEQPRIGKVGLFRASDTVEDAAELPPGVRRELRNSFRWFDAHLPVPRRLPRNAICWFRADAEESLARLRALIEMYRLLGHPVLMQATRSPGRVVYRDAYQVAAVPYPDRRVTSSAV